MSDPCILIVEQDLLVRTPLAEYLRGCGYLVLEASSPGNARTLLEEGSRRVDIVLAEVKSGEASGFALASWVRTHLPNTQVVLAGTIATAAEKAGDICQEGPALSKPYDHRLVLDHIQHLLAGEAPHRVPFAARLEGRTRKGARTASVPTPDRPADST
jgi:DNA-binding response OmpR family regulator